MTTENTQMTLETTPAPVTGPPVETAPVEVPEVTAVTLQHNIAAIQVVDAPSFKASQALEATIRDAEKIEVANVQPQIDDAHAKHKRLVGIRNKIKDTYAELKKSLRTKQFSYRDQQQKIADAAARKAAEEARQAAAAEAAARAESLRVQGQAGHAKAVEQAPIPVQAVAAPVAVPKVKGVVTVWKAEVIDKDKFILAAWKGQNGLTKANIMVDEVLLGKMVRAHQGQVELPGILITKTER